MGSSEKEINLIPGLLNEKSLHLRSVAETILNFLPELPRNDDPLSLPIAGLRLLEYEGLTINPREVLPEQYRPIVIFDLDETLWTHVSHLVRAVSSASGIDVRLKDVIAAGHTRNIPQLKENPAAMSLHDQIVRGEHPLYFPYINIAWPEAVDVVKATDRMGHRYCFLSGRPPELFDATLRTLSWNSIPLAESQKPQTDALKHPLPLDKYLYCAHTDLVSTDQYKHNVVKHWLDNLRDADWKGKLVIVDDVLSPFQCLLETGEALGIALLGPLNQNTQSYEGELRETTWKDIGDRLMQIHKEALQLDPTPWRVFDCSPALQDMLLLVRKSEVGTSQFSLEDSQFTLIPRQELEQNQQIMLQEPSLT